MKTDLIELEKTVADIIGRFAFLITDPVEGKPTLPYAVNIIIVPFSGIKSGQVKIVCDDELGEKLLSNLIDVETASDVDIVDALQELGNVFAGNLLTTVYGSEHAFDLKPPEWVAARSSSLNFDEDWFFLDCEGSILGVSIAEN